MARPHQKESFRKWVSLLAVPVTGLVALIGFWRLSPGLTFVVAVVALACMLVALWIAGKKD